MAVEQPGTTAHTKATTAPTTGPVNSPIIRSIVILTLGTLFVAGLVAIFMPDHLATTGTLLAFAAPIIASMFLLQKGMNEETKRELQDLRVSVDGRLEELLKESGKAAHAQGVIDERQGVIPPTSIEIAEAEELKEATEAIAAPEKPNGATKTIVLEAKDMHVKAEGDVNVSKDSKGPQPDGS